MARYTVAYGSFISRLDEVDLLRADARAREKSDPFGGRAQINALCRGSVVLLSSHVEAYIKELGELALESFQTKSVTRSKFSSRFFYHMSKDVLDEIKDTSDPERIAEKVFGFIDSDIVLWSRTGPFNSRIPSERFNQGFSNPAFRKIKSYFNRFGYEDYKRDFYAELGSDGQLIENTLNHMVSTRNSIAHGDPSATKTPTDIEDMTNKIKRFCRVTDKVFGGWCKQNFCASR